MPSQQGLSVLKDTRIANTCHSEITFEAHYPEENPKKWQRDISNALSYTGVFDGLESRVI
jgi:hypothetical protein